MSSRRKFIRQIGAAGLAFPLAANSTSFPTTVDTRVLPNEPIKGSDQPVRIGIIGFGIMGYRNTQTLMQLPGIVLAGVSDLYQGRLERARELYGKWLFVTTDYKELLKRTDIDAVFICTSDQWHQRISIDAMRRGKAVYCEKPVVHRMEEGLELIRVQQETNAILQVGSQRVSSIVYAAAKDHYQAGAIGQLNCIEASFDRHTSLGAWQYTMPPDATAERVDWQKYFPSGVIPAFDAKRLFWWRNYREYGTGVAGDLFVHLLSGIHFLTNSKGPSRIFATGDISYWKDGRNVPDLMTAVMEYKACSEHPAFQLLLKVNLASGAEKVEGGKVKFYGTEGMIDFGWNAFTIQRNKFSAAPAIGGWDALDTYPETMQKQIMQSYREKFPEAAKSETVLPAIRYAAPEGYDDRVDHFRNFFAAIREGKPVVEDAVFGFRAAAPCLACNESYFQQKVIHWDPVKMKLS